MIGRYIPEFLRRAPAPGVRAFALLGLFEASVRGMLVSVWPLVLYDSLGSAKLVSAVYFAAGLASLAFGLMVPWISRHVPRRWMYTVGASLYLLGPLLAAVGPRDLVPIALVMTNWGTVTVFICTNAYVMDYIAREELGRSETFRLLYSAIPWTIGPVLGVWLWRQAALLPFAIAMSFAILLLATFWVLRMGNGKVITRAHGPAPNPLAYLGRFFAQPRLIAGWLFAVLRSAGWWVYVVYLPIFCIEAGLGEQIGSAAFSTSNAILLLSPFMLRWMQKRGLRRSVQIAFVGGSACFVAAAMGELWPPLAVIGLFAGSFFLVMLDTFGGLPFLMAVRPAERTEMAAVYASFRDVSGILTPGVAWAVLLVTPVAGVFAAAAFGLGIAAAIAGRMHPRLGSPDPRRVRA